MSRYIDADKLISHIKDEIKGCATPVGGRANGKTLAYGTELGLRMALSFAETLPTADVVAVVRCRDCRWWTKQKDSIQGRCGMYERYPTGAWYCANGERREE